MNKETVSPRQRATAAGEPMSLQKTFIHHYRPLPQARIFNSTAILGFRFASPQALFCRLLCGKV